MSSGRDNTKNYPEVEKSGLTNSKNLKKLLQYRVEGGDENVEKQFQNAP